MQSGDGLRRDRHCVQIALEELRLTRTRATSFQIMRYTIVLVRLCNLMTSTHDDKQYLSRNLHSFSNMFNMIFLPALDVFLRSFNFIALYHQCYAGDEKNQLWAVQKTLHEIVF